MIGGGGVQDDLDAGFSLSFFFFSSSSSSSPAPLMLLSSSPALMLVGVVLSDFFHHEGFLDVVPSDVFAGIILLRFQQRAKKLIEREEQIDYLKQKLISRYVSTPRSFPNGSSAPPRTLFKYPPHVAEAVEIVAKTLNVAAPEDTNVTEFMTRTKTQYLTALEILNQENFHIDLPVLNSDDADELSNYSASIDGNDSEFQNQSQSVFSNAKSFLQSGTGISSKSVGSVSISSKDLGSKNPSINSIKCSDEDCDKRITPRVNPALTELFSNDEVHSIEMSSPRVITPHSGHSGETPKSTESANNGHEMSFEMSRNDSLEHSLSEIEAEFGDEFDENGVSLTFNEPFDPKVNKADLKHSIATNFAEIEGLRILSSFILHL
jgi:hypothetical protein